MLTGDVHWLEVDADTARKAAVRKNELGGSRW